MTKKHKKHHKEGKQELPTPSPDAQTYSGPIISRAMKKEEEMYEVPLIFTGVIASTAGGVIDTYFGSGPSAYALSEWTNLTNLYGEYRMLGFEVRYYPNNRYSKISVTCTPLVVLTDRESPSATLGSYQTAASHESAKILSLEDPWKSSARMQNAEESQFRAVGSTSNLYSIKMYADGLSVSTTYGRAFVYMLLQFRARR